MQALVQTGYGPSALQLADMPTPESGPNEVRIRVSHAGVNPVDYKIRDGQLRLIRPMSFPQVVGNEACGYVDSLGANVTRLSLGQRVFTRVSDRTLGCFAEFVCADEKYVAAAPVSLTCEVAARAPLVGLTAMQALCDVAHITAATRLLIHAGAGSVGRMAIQFAKLVGAHVTTTVSERGEAVVQSLGADRIINYRTQDFAALPDRFDVILDAVGGETLAKSFHVAAPGAKVVSISGMPEPHTAEDLGGGWWMRWLFRLTGMSSMRAAARHACTYRYYFMHGDGSQLAEIAGLIDAGKLQIFPVTTFDIEAFAEVMSCIESGRAAGKIVLRIAR